jgi:hypothetical protein
MRRAPGRSSSWKSAASCARRERLRREPAARLDDASDEIGIQAARFLGSSRVARDRPDSSDVGSGSCGGVRVCVRRSAHRSGEGLT